MDLSDALGTMVTRPSFQLPAQSGRIGLACELIRRVASTTVQQAGGWKTGRMVSRYSAGVAGVLAAFCAARTSRTTATGGSWWNT